MVNRYRHVLKNGSLEEVRQLLIEYHDALVKIKQLDYDVDNDELWIDNSTPVSLFIDMHVAQLINVDYGKKT